MYIKKVKIRNIRSISEFSMEFKKPVGWNVLIGDNGSGKSTLIRSIALALVGPEEALGLRSDWRDWLAYKTNSGQIRLDIEKQDIDKQTGRSAKLTKWLVPNIINFKKQNEIVEISAGKTPKIDALKYNWGKGTGWFSVAFGPYRRFAGGNQEWTKVFYSQPKLGAHLSAFGEDVALTETLDWLVKLNYKLLENNISGEILNDLKLLINSPQFLPHNAKLDKINSDGVFFKDGNGLEISVNQLSDGYRSILSLTLELIRQMLRVYGPNIVFKNIRENKIFIDIPGVVLIDEIDAHLHPTWQTKIGEWFIKYFPQIQFIVTTHSPLICRACANGTIWRLATPGSEIESSEIVGTDKKRLIFGNVLDAYGTEIFGEDVSQSHDAEKMLKELADLNVKSFKGTISENEKKRIITIQKILPTA
jgi:predicted ATPase